ncbi:hypothetical protein ACFFOS_18505, partial [Nocardioides kongjuensis]|uniref:hypothetical protein n=1 Tax=Nocardioides kongjuensis TaxID=349522 RepID=UPI0035F0E6EB
MADHGVDHGPQEQLLRRKHVVQRSQRDARFGRNGAKGQTRDAGRSQDPEGRGDDLLLALGCSDVGHGTPSLFEC